MAMLVSKNKKIRFIFITPKGEEQASSISNTLSGNPSFCWAYINRYFIGYLALDLPSEKTMEASYHA
jgi:hypothetical protein